MDQPKNATPVAPSWGLSGNDAREVLRQHREHLLRYATVPPMPTDEAPARAVEEPVLSIDDLPDQLQRLVHRYESDWPNVRLVPRGYIVTGPTGDVPAPIGLGDVPAVDELVSFAVTETVVSSDKVEVRSHLLVAARVLGSTSSSPKPQAG